MRKNEVQLGLTQSTPLQNSYLQFEAVLVAILAACVASQLVAQEPVPIENPLRTIQEAEAEGRHFAAATGGPVNQLSDTGGTSERRCVDASGYRSIRSGDFEAGTFIQRYLPTQKLWWIPLHPPDMPFGQFPKPGTMDLLIRATRLDSAVPESVAFRSSRWGYPSNGHGTIYAGLFFPSNVELPSPGRWMLVVTAGENWGCFVATFN